MHKKQLLMEKALPWDWSNWVTFSGSTSNLSSLAISTTSANTSSKSWTPQSHPWRLESTSPKLLLILIFWLLSMNHKCSGWHLGWWIFHRRIKNIKIMKKFAVLQELPKCDTETLSEQMLFINGTNRLVQHKVATNPQCKKKKKKMEHLQSSIRWSRIKQGIPVCVLKGRENARMPKLMLSRLKGMPMADISTLCSPPLFYWMQMQWLEQQL